MATLTVLDGGQERALVGEDLLDQIAPIIAERLPLLCSDDPWRPAFERLLRAAPTTERSVTR